MQYLKSKLVLSGIILSTCIMANETLEPQFEGLLKAAKNTKYEDLAASQDKQKFIEKLDFDPAMVKYYDRARKTLSLTQAEEKLFKKNGFVSIDHNQRFSFASAYYGVWTRDLPVLITTDSILHAMHCSYDDMLKELEIYLFLPSIDDILTRCHEKLKKDLATVADSERKNYRDIDLYIAVARNLIEGAGAQKYPVGNPDRKRIFENKRYTTITTQDKWDGSVLVHSLFGQDDEVLEILNKIQSLQMEVPRRDSPTEIYGGQRFIDYSQFKPRGHYTKNPYLRRYFRAMMWLGRADSGFNILNESDKPNRENPRSISMSEKAENQSIREMKNAILITSLMQETGAIEDLQRIDNIVNFMIGESDNLKACKLYELMERSGIKTIADCNAKVVKEMQKQIAEGDFGRQLIRSQSLYDPTKKVVPPSLFQIFGQRFVVDSFIMSKVVHDEVKKRRYMPSPLDVMAGLGNPTAIQLLKDELKTWEYSPQMKACQDYISSRTSKFWNANLYNLWLNSLRTLDDVAFDNPYFPQIMKTRQWQYKQLQTQLSSWTELRHDTLLYAKQSYTLVAGCEYPHGYVEPYPGFYQKIKYFADRSYKLIESADYGSENAIKQKQLAFYKRMSTIIGQLESLAIKQLKGKPFSEEEIAFIKAWIDMRRVGSGGETAYDGHYVNLYYKGEPSATKWDALVSDVHTDPNNKMVLEVATGDVNFLVTAIDNGEDKMVYAGPIFSYYEFQSKERMTDEEWQDQLLSNKLPERPEWTKGFQGPRIERNLENNDANYVSPFGD